MIIGIHRHSEVVVLPVVLESMAGPKKHPYSLGIHEMEETFASWHNKVFHD